jgi:hypothetical protein
VTEVDLPRIIQRVAQHPEGRVKRGHILLGPRYSPALAARLFQGVLPMKESSTYQAILEEGRGEGAVAEVRKVLRPQGDEVFGPPDARTEAVIDGLNDLARLEKMRRRVRTAASWQEVLAIELLEWAGTSEALRILGELAGAAPQAQMTREAVATLERLRARSAPTQQFDPGQWRPPGR